MQSAVSAQDRYGLIIGTNYTGNKANIPPLDLCEKDAQFIRSQLQKVGNFKDLRVLLGAQVTKENVQREIRNLANVAKANDTVFLYFAGHGTTQRDAKAPNGMRNYLVCFDRPHISDEELNQYLSQIRSPKTLLVMDCCYSGGIAKKGQGTRGASPIPIPQGSDGVVKQNADDYYFQNKPVISSTDDNQTAIEVGGSIKHGVFTYNFGRALENADLNGDKVVTALEAFFVTRDETVKMAKRFNHEQVPQISGDAAGVFLAGNPAPTPPPTPPSPPVTISQPLPPSTTPPPAFIPVVPNPVTPPFVYTPQEPPAPPVRPSVGTILIKTSIVKERELKANRGPGDAYKLLERQGKIMNPSEPVQEDRKIRVLIDGQEFPMQVLTVKSPIWGSYMDKGRVIPGEVYHVRIPGITAGVHKVEVMADDYPKFETAQGVIPNQDNIIDITTSANGLGAIQGRVFYKTLDNPVASHPIYMPTIVSTRGVQKVNTDKDGYFFFTNLKPGSYELKASFMENLKLENSNIVVKPGEVTKVDIILNVKLPSTKTKY